MIDAVHCRAEPANEGILAPRNEMLREAGNRSRRDTLMRDEINEVPSIR